MRATSLLFFSLLVVLSSSTRADTVAAAEDNDPLTRRLWLFPGVDFGFSSLSTSIAGEESKSGFGGGVRAKLAYYWPKWVAETGVGWFYKSIKGTRPTGFEGTLSTKTFFFQVDGRYRFTPTFQLGPFLAFHFGADVSHRPTISPIVVGEPDQGSMLLAGLEGIYDTRSGETPLRFGVRLDTDLNVPARNLVEVQGFVQIGFPISPGHSHHLHSDDEYFQLPLARIYFKTGSAELADTSLELLQKVGNFLAKNIGSFTKLEVEGHTDKQGGFSYNIDLSERRAERVMEVFISCGVPRAIVMSRGYGYTKPIKQSESADEPKNRRVFIKLFGIGDRDSFKQELRTLTE